MHCGVCCDEERRGERGREREMKREGKSQHKNDMGKGKDFD